MLAILRTKTRTKHTDTLVYIWPAVSYPVTSSVSGAGESGLDGRVLHPCLWCATINNIQSHTDTELYGYSEGSEWTSCWEKTQLIIPNQRNFSPSTMRRSLSCYAIFKAKTAKLCIQNNMLRCWFTKMQSYFLELPPKKCLTWTISLSS